MVIGPVVASMVLDTGKGDLVSEDGVDAGEYPGSPIRFRNICVGCQDLVEELRKGVEGAIDVPADTLLQDVEVASRR